MDSMNDNEKLRIALVVDPRFSGGTSSAVAHEIRAISRHVDLTVHAIETKMFKGRDINPNLEAALQETGTDLIWDAKVIRGEVVVVHNNSCLKFNEKLDCRILCDRLVVVTHENFLRPDGGEGFDVSRTVAMIERAAIAKARYFAPVSGYNRQGVASWLSTSGAKWKLVEFNWFNICDFEIEEPTDQPMDRRGRLSRAGFEKFPSMRVMKSHFPASAQSNVILGGDSFLEDSETIPDHWKVLPFGATPVLEFLKDLDFFVYFTHPLWRESFGRVIAEAICAGKVVITDPGTAETFGPAVIASDGSDVDAVIAAFIAEPENYVRFVKNAQRHISGFGSARFVQDVIGGVKSTKGEYHALL